MSADLERFVVAQDAVWPTVRAELVAGAKRGHWIWFVFPQIAGLGRSEMSARYALDGHASARAYLDHPLLGSRLRDCVGLMLDHGDRPVEAILGPVDAMKFRSCLTLFQAAAPEEALWAEALGTFYAGLPDAATQALLG